MDKFTTLTAVAAPMPMQNIDTDKVIPARFLKTIKRSGLGVHLFDTLRFDTEGKERPEFVLNQEPYRKAQIIIAHENFGCGSLARARPLGAAGFRHPLHHRAATSPTSSSTTASRTACCRSACRARSATR